MRALDAPNSRSPFQGERVPRGCKASEVRIKWMFNPESRGKNESRRPEPTRARDAQTKVRVSPGRYEVLADPFRRPAPSGSVDVGMRAQPAYELTLVAAVLAGRSALSALTRRGSAGDRTDANWHDVWKPELLSLT